MANLIPMDQAANMLGMTVEKLTELRSNNEIFGYRDGQNWKFKMSELERVANELDIQLKASVEGEAPLILDDEDEDDFGFDLSDSSAEISSSDISLGLEDSSELSLEDSGELLTPGGASSLSGVDEFSFEDSGELSLEDSGELLMGAGSLSGSTEAETVKPTNEFSLEDSGELSLEDSGELLMGAGSLSGSNEAETVKPANEFSLEDSGEIGLEDSGDLLMLEGASDVLSSDDGLDDDESLSFGSSDISLAASSKDLPSPSDTNALLAAGSGSNLLDDEEVSGGATPSDTGMMLAAADNIDDDDDDDLFGDDLELIEDDSFEESAELSSDFEDSDLVLDDSDSSAEIVLAGGESGINLGLNASGIELDEEPLELGGSDIDSLELPEDDDDLLELDDLGDSGAMAQEDEFKLTALEEDLEDQSSGSQVIALEDSGIYNDEGEASILGSDVLSAQPAMLPASDPGASPGFTGSVFDQADAGTMAPAAAAGAMGMAAVAAPPEAPYTIWQVIGLGFVAALLLVGGMVGYDIARNLWMPEDQVISSGVMKFFLEITGMG